MYVSIEQLLEMAHDKGASDLHVSAGESPKIRLHGELMSLGFQPFSAEDTEMTIKPLLDERHQKEVDELGESDFSHAIEGYGRFRVNVFKQKGTYGTVIRLISTDIPDAHKLGVPQSVIELTKKKRGLVLVTGPTGSGKSTTLASLIDIINTNYSEHIITMEDPIEYSHHHKKSIVNQREIGMDTMSFANGIRAALREDPDVILVGEMRDLETISSAITAAETGHLVFSTLHTIGAAPTIDRIIDVFPPHQQAQIRIQLAAVLECVISQQLIPVVGHNGRVAAFEVMHGTPAIKNLIREGKSHQIPSIIQTSKALGMVTMDDYIYDLFKRRTIDATQAVAFAVDKEQMTKKVVYL